MKILVNCALPYANGPLHLGHIAGANLNADIFVRFQRMKGNEVMYVSGSDEYGTPTTIAADRQKISPQEIVDRFHREQEESFRNLDINFDFFSRTTYKEHAETVKEFFLDIYGKGLLKEKTMVSPFCPTDNRFMPDRYIEGTCPHCGFEEARGDQCDNCGRILDPQDLTSPRCVLCGTTPEFRETKHMFFRLDQFQDRLLQWLDTKDFWRHSILSFTRNFIKSGLKERPITRDIEWGVPVPLPGYEHKRIYVWFEALIGYVSGARILSEKMGRKDYWKEFFMDPEVRMYNFMGKDNIIFHTIIWPAMLMAREGYNLPYMVVANEFLTFNEKQFSKSRGIGYSVDDILKLASRDYVRYYMASIMPENSDSDFSLEDFQSRVNGELIDKFGNYVHRLVSFIDNNKLAIRSEECVRDKRDKDALEYADSRISAASGYLERVEIKKAMGEWLELVKYANSYFNESEPWKLIKTDPSKCRSKLHTSLVLAQYITGLAYPIIPSAAARILETIGSSKYREGGFTMDLFTLEGSEFSPVRSDPPFTKLDIIEENPNFADLRVGRILEAKPHPNADRLYVLKVDMGDREIQLVAGLRAHYSAEELAGMHIVVVNNLKWVKLRGEESQGMLLAADDGDTVATLLPRDSTAKAGDAVNIGDYGYNSGGKIEIDALKTLDIRMDRVNGGMAATASLKGRRFELRCGDANLSTSRPVSEGATVR